MHDAPRGNLPRGSRTTRLDDWWRSVANETWARALLPHFDLSALRPISTDNATKICSSCVDTDFLSPVLDLGRTLQDLERGSYDCRVCKLLLHCLLKAQPKPDGKVKLFIDDDISAFRTSDDGEPLVSIYSDPHHGPVLAHAQFGLPFLPEFGSTQQFRLLRQWAQLCDETHDCLSGKTDTKATGSMPTRLVYVGSDTDPRMRLVHASNRATDKYMALSHCWGVLSAQEKFCLYANNKKDLEQDIPFEALPKTFRDAVTVTRELGISYIWIDSLCIIQDDDQDWEAEAARMGTVFSSAYCTIAASSATCSLEGFLGTRTQREATAIKTIRGHVYLAESIDDFQKHVEQGALNKRGWVFQERALSRRTIHFTSTQVYWECGGGIQCETQARLRNSQSEFIGDPNFPVYALKHHKDDRIRLIQYLYRVYSGLSLTKMTDRPKAILGLQERLASAFESSAKYGVLSAYFERMLLWVAQDRGGMSRIAYAPAQRVPSWSWMAYAGKIQYMEIPFKQVNWMGNFIDPLGSLSNEADWDGRLLAQANNLLIDQAELETKSRIDRGDCKIDCIHWKCVVCGQSKLSDEYGNFDHYVLLIRQTPSGGAMNTYERVGVGVLLGTHIVPGTTEVWVV
ncbi:hypothetical protein F66182_7109 [Fusarium sp. NRRL 66182]|nr:hypothetical protein F66182_7109 [Fusarium sp. NRRL 66182]